MKENANLHVSLLNADNGYSKSLQFTTRQVLNVARLDTMQIWHTTSSAKHFSRNTSFTYYIVQSIICTILHITH